MSLLLVLSLLILCVYLNLIDFVLILLYFTLLYFTLLYFTLLYFTLLYFTLLYFTLLYFTLLYFTVLYFTVLYFTLLYFTLLYCTLLYFTLFVLFCFVYHFLPCRKMGTKVLCHCLGGYLPALPPAAVRPEHALSGIHTARARQGFGGDALVRLLAQITVLLQPQPCVLPSFPHPHPRCCSGYVCGPEEGHAPPRSH